jgi:glycosyltransferase involved in cell wall biosynthesis
MRNPARTLYVCYFGLREPLVQTQVLPYLRELARGGVEVSLLTFEPVPARRWPRDELAAWRSRLAGDGIEWESLTYHRRPSLPATAWDVLAGAWRAARIARRRGVDVFHGRSHVGAAIGALARRAVGGRLIFDFRGLLAEGYVHGGHWPAGGLLYRVTKRAERCLLDTADGFVVLTDRAGRMLFPAGTPGRPLAVIPCCVDAARFAAAARSDRHALRREMGLEGRFVLVHTGQLGGYYLTRETAALIAAARREDPSAFALVLTQGPREPAIEELARHGLGPSESRVATVPPEEVPLHLAAADAALCLIRPGASEVAMSPTKVGEYLAAGLPVIVTAGIGDLDEHVAGRRVGVLLRRLDETGYRDALRALAALRADATLAARCRETARELYDLETVGGPRYRALYEAVLAAPRRAS